MKKSKRYVRICAALLCAVLCLSVNVAPAMAAKVTQADIDALKGNAASLDKKQKEIQSKLNSLKNDKAAAVQKKTLLDDQIANTNAKISNTEAQISDYNALISQAET
ncbi:MAG: peptidase M23, partial [Dysosmobacter sp.]